VTPQITVVSGKGGTGKTTLTALWGSMANRPVLVDADVDASNLPLAYSHEVREQHSFVGRDVAVVNESLCKNCGVCARECRFGAFFQVEGQFRVDPLACEGCTLCSLMCPLEAITMQPHLSGTWFVSETGVGPLVHAQLGIAEGNSGKLVTQVRRAGEKLAEERSASVVLVDGPPGIGCQTTAAMAGASLVVLVTEPSASGRHDMERLLSVTNRLGVLALVVLNKIDLAPAEEALIRATASRMGAEYIGSVPFIPEIPGLLASGTLIKNCPQVLKEVADRLWGVILERADMEERVHQGEAEHA